jgi:hypothetical protein
MPRHGFVAINCTGERTVADHNFIELDGESSAYLARAFKWASRAVAKGFVSLDDAGNPVPSLSPMFPAYIEDVVLVTDTLQCIAIPANVSWVVFAFDGDFRAKLGVVSTTFSLPAASTSNGSGSELNPAARRIPPKLGDGTTTPTHICLRAPAAQKGSLSFFG